MFSFLNNKSFVDFVLGRGRIPFIVHGDLTVNANFTFWWGIHISPPTYKVRVHGENKTSNGPRILGDVYIHELTGETVFPGEVELPENTMRGIGLALSSLERWANFLCLANGNPKIQVEVQLPVRAVAETTRELTVSDLDTWADLINYHASLPDAEKQQVENALWWYRKGCAASKYSVFDGYTAYWNCLEILCGVSGSKIRQGEQVAADVQSYLRDKKQISPGHILHCYNAFVNYSIAAQMEDALKTSLGTEQGEQWAFYCFKVQPSHDRFYQIRNDINHGNIRENDGRAYQRVYLRGMLLRQLVLRVLHKRLGRTLSLGRQDNVHTLVNDVLNHPDRLDFD